jgi:hypothetical protein
MDTRRLTTGAGARQIDQTLDANPGGASQMPEPAQTLAGDGETA